MAWTAPKTWSASEVVLASGTGSLNEQVRDNLLVLSTHAHSGAAGMGASTLSSVTLSGLNTATFADQSGNPSTDGRLQRNGTELLYYDGTTAQNLTASDQSAGTASLRTLGTGATQAAAGNHTHAISATADNYAVAGFSFNDDSEHDIATLTASAASTDNAWVITGSSDGTDRTTGFVYTYRIYYDGSVVDTISSADGGDMKTLFYVQDIASTSAKVIKFTVQRTSGGSLYICNATIGFQEVEI